MTKKCTFIIYVHVTLAILKTREISLIQYADMIHLSAHKLVDLEHYR